MAGWVGRKQTSVTMSGVNGVAPPALWQEAKTPEGRPYYYNTTTKATQWTKPVDLMTPVEVSENGIRCVKDEG